MEVKMITVEVAYALPHEQRIIQIQIAAGSTIRAAIERSGILVIFPDIDLVKQKVGVFSELRELSDLVNDGDRIEIYRPLIIDPKDARRKKAHATRKR